jgi:hypothetical protein
MYKLLRYTQWHSAIRLGRGRGGCSIFHFIDGHYCITLNTESHEAPPWLATSKKIWAILESSLYLFQIELFNLTNNDNSLPNEGVGVPQPAHPPARYAPGYTISLC